MNDVSVDLALEAPLGGKSPVGRDLTYEPSFQALQAEVDKATALAGQSVDWRRVQLDCIRLLRDETKDLRCASWLVLAMSHLEGWSGTARALAIYRAIIEAHWDAMYPPAKRTRARVALIEWVWEGLRQSLSSRDVTADDGAEVRALLPALRGLEGVLASKLGDLSPGAGPLRAVLRDKAERAPETAAAVAEAVAPPVEPARAPRVPSPAFAPKADGALVAVVAAAPRMDNDPTDTSSPAAIDRITDSMRNRLFSLSRAERATDPTAPRPYRLVRIGAWLVVDSPPDVEGERTFVRPPRSDDANELRGRFMRGDWASLRDAAEDSLIEHIFWLDLNRFTCIALEKLGPSFAQARTAIVCETVAFLDRLPNLESMCFEDGTPLADADTLAWLQVQRVRRKPGSSEVEADPAADPVQTLLSRARARCAEGQVTEALAEGLKQVETLATARSRFRARVGVAKLAVDSGSKQIGVAILEQLLIEIDETLEAWEPDLCATAIRDFLLVSAYREGDNERHVTERQDLLFRRLLRLNPATALHLVS